MRDDKETLDWVCSEFERAKTLPPEQANHIKRAAKLIFDKRFPNPDRCPACCGKIRSG
jgi:hypothetical protein